MFTKTSAKARLGRLSLAREISRVRPDCPILHYVHEAIEDRCHWIAPQWGAEEIAEYLSLVSIRPGDTICRGSYQDPEACGTFLRISPNGLPLIRWEA